MTRREAPGVRCEGGFTLVETLVATLLMVVVTGAAMALLAPAATMARTVPEAVDMQQRVRVAVDVITRDLIAAGAGIDAGSAAGSLGALLPVVAPRRTGLLGADPPGTVRADAISLLTADPNFAQTTTTTAITSRTPAVALASAAACPAGDPYCGLTPGTDVVVVDDQAHFDVFRVLRLSGGLVEMESHDPGPSYAYATGARVISVRRQVFYFDPGARQLRVSDGYQGDAPIVDNVVGLTFTYSGDPNPPRTPRPADGTANCLYDSAGVPAGGLQVLARAGGSLAPLPLTTLSDGPWCGEHGARFDVDLLRIRQVRVSLRVQAGPAEFRASGPAFAVPGTSRRADQTLPDYVVTFDVAPRNLGLAR